MKHLSLLLLTFFLSSAAITQVKFIGESFENGFRYPRAVFEAEKSIEDSLNKTIRSRIADLEKSDFCIGEFGYVQKGSHLQLHLMCNCIDMANSELRYIFFDLATGNEVAQSEFFEPKAREKALSIIQQKIKSYSTQNTACSVLYAEMQESISFDKMDIRLAKDGIEVRPFNSEDCERFPVKVSYMELSECLKYRQL